MEKCYKKTGMKIYDLQDIRDMVGTSGRATPHMTVDTGKKVLLLFFAGLLPGKRKTMLSAKADPPHRQDRTFFASLTIRCQILKIPLTRGKCHPFLPSCFNCTYFPPCHCYAVSHSPHGGICVHSCPFVSIRGSYSPPLLFSCLSCFSWLTPDFVHSCPFVVQILPRLHRFVYFVFFVVTPAFRVHSWFLLSPLIFFVLFVCFVVK